MDALCASVRFGRGGRVPRRSLLFVYDGAADYAHGAEPPRAPPPLDARGPPGVQLKMIDFAHVRKDDTPDAGYILGLTRVIRLFDVLLGHGPAPPDA